jgi:subtilisin family serine protease
MATPVVSGVAALILSLDPNLNVKVLRNAILNAVSHVSSWKGKNATDGIIQADAALSQFRGGGQVWPHKIRLTPGSNHEMTAYRLAGVTWSVSNPQVASVTAAGVVQAVGVGSAEVIATNANGESVKAVVDVVAKSSGGGGCGKSSASLSNESTAGISFLMILPFLFAFGLRLRRRK